MKNTRTNVKQLITSVSLLLALLVISLSLTGCLDSNTENKLSKVQYSEAFSAVSLVFDSAIDDFMAESVNLNAIDLSIPDSHFTSDMSAWRDDFAMTALPSLVYGYAFSLSFAELNIDEEHEKNAIISGTVSGTEMSATNMNIKMQTTDKDGIIYGSATLTTAGNTTYDAYITYSIDYDFENSTINEFKYVFYGNSATVSNSIANMLKYSPETSLMGLTSQSPKYNTLKVNLKNEADKFIDKTTDETGYDFSGSFAQAAGAVGNG
ncbi:MAG: hypothetical protein IJZ29_04735 [Clostridia bacterium]|nr:hypothetical protein [Clostridia bacterium]